MKVDELATLLELTHLEPQKKSVQARFGSWNVTLAPRKRLWRLTVELTKQPTFEKVQARSRKTPDDDVDIGEPRLQVSALDWNRLAVLEELRDVQLRDALVEVVESGGGVEGSHVTVEGKDLPSISEAFRAARAVAELLSKSAVGRRTRPLRTLFSGGYVEESGPGLLHLHHDKGVDACVDIDAPNRTLKHGHTVYPFGDAAELIFLHKRLFNRTLVLRLRSGKDIELAVDHEEALRSFAQKLHDVGLPSLAPENRWFRRASDPAPELDGIRCPKCQWRAKPSSRWTCQQCEHSWNTFQTRGKCPRCSYQWRDTVCPDCRKWSPHDEWYEAPAPEP